MTCRALTNSFTCIPKTHHEGYVSLSHTCTPRAEREAAQTGRQARVNKLVTVGSEDQEQGSGGCTELTPAVQELCRHADAFVLVVDACYRTEDGKTAPRVNNTHWEEKFIILEKLFYLWG